MRSWRSRITETLGFMKRDRARSRKPIRNCAQTDFYTSHEALLLGYEQAMTRVSIQPAATTTRRPGT